MVDPALLDHLAKHGMESEVRQFLGALAEKKPHPRYIVDHQCPASEDYIIGCELDPGINVDLIESLGTTRQPIPEVTVYYHSGARRIFVGRQCVQLCPALVAYCEWRDEQNRNASAGILRWTTPPELPALLR